MTPTDAASLVVSIMGLVSGAAVLIFVRQARMAIGVALELFTAAGLLRLSARSTWSALAAAAVILMVRRLVVSSLRSAPGEAADSPPSRTGIPRA